MRTATGVNLGVTAVRAVRLALNADQLELVAAACKDFQPAGAANGSPVVVVSGDAGVGVGADAAADAQGEAKAVSAPQPQPQRQAPARTASRQEPELDPERERELRADLASLLRRSGIRSSQMVLGLGGASALIRYLQIPPVPPWKLEMMMKFEVQEQGSSGEPSAFDYRILDLPDVGGQVTVMLSQVQEKRLLARLELARRAGMGRPDVDLNCLGLFNAYLYGHGADGDRTVMVVDIGAENIDMVVVKGPALCFARSVSGGGSRFTASVSEALGLPFDEAEDLKCAKGAILPAEAAGNEDLPDVQKRLSAALEREIGALAGVIDSSLMYCRAQTKQAKMRPDEILISGGGSMLPGLSEALARRLRMRVSRLEPFRKISMGALSGRELEEVSAQAPRYAVAVGLAASRLVGEAVRFSLMLESAKARRRFLEGGIYVWYAAAMVWLAAAAVIFASWRNRDLLASKQVSREELTRRAEEDNALFERSYAAAEQRRDEVKALEERVYSGRDIVKLLSYLKKRTGGRFERDILVLEASNTVPAIVPDPRPEEKTQSFQKARCVYLRGVATARRRGSTQAAQDQAEAAIAELIENYRRELEKQGPDNDIVKEVVPRYQKVEDNADKSSPVVRGNFVFQAILKPVELETVKPGGPSKAETVPAETGTGSGKDRERVR